MPMKNWTNTAFGFYYKQRYKIIQRYMHHPDVVQKEVLNGLLKSARYTEFGRKYDFRSIHNSSTYANRIPIQDYEAFKPYIQRMMHGEKDVLWDGRVNYFSKSSGTTSAKSKFLPVSRQSLKRCHTRGSWDAMTMLYHNRPDATIFSNKNMVMGGSIEKFGPYPKTEFGDVSGFLIRNIPAIARPFFAIDFETALMGEWEEKLERLAHIGANTSNITMIGGVPTWTVVLFRRILELTGKDNLLEVWPDFQVYMHGGVSFAPYRTQFNQFLPSDQVSFQEIYNASEGYFAAQDDFSDPGMLLLLNNGIYFEFMPMEEWGKEDPKALPIWEVEKDKNYAVVISTNSGLWRYSLGDTVSFTSVHPYRIKVTGRTKQYVNAFGEEVMVANTDKALTMACEETQAQVKDYTVAPIYFAGSGQGGHEWLIEFKVPPVNLEYFRALLDQNLQNINSDYEAKRYKDIALKKLTLKVLPEGSFNDWLRSKGKYGGQHKVPRLANHRKYVEEILYFLGEEV
ncbi:MAG: GH3 auxin-responsive promoter family protein [Saprospiraceae bacterium]